MTGIVGVSTSVIGAFLYALFGKLSAKYNVKRRNARLEKLKGDIKHLSDLSTSDSKVIIFCFRHLFYILALSALASALSFFSVIDYLFGTVLSVSIWVAIFLIGIQAFNTLSKLSRFEEHEQEVNEEIDQLSKLQGSQKS